jgi:hypothetical protein
MNRKLNFTIAEEPAVLRTHKILDLCDYLTSRVLEPKFAQAGAKWDARFMDFFTHDPNTNPMEPTGRIKFTVPPLFAGRIGELEDAVRTELGALGIKTGPFSYEPHSVVSSIQVISIPIVENPTVLISPPDVNIGYNHGFIVLRDLLGYKPANGRYEFAAQDVLKRANALTDEKIIAATVSPLKTAQGVQRVPSAVTVKSFKRCLEEIKLFATWATQHNYRTLAAA